MLKDEFCTREGSRCVILRGAVVALPLPRVGRCVPLVSTAALQPSFNGSLRLPSFSRGLRPLVSTKLSASSFSRGLRPLVSTQLSASSFSRGLRPLVSTQPYGCWLDSVDSL